VQSHFLGGPTKNLFAGGDEINARIPTRSRFSARGLAAIVRLKRDVNARMQRKELFP
jgi:hypothetical protein